MVNLLGLANQNMIESKMLEWCSNYCVAHSFFETELKNYTFENFCVEGYRKSDNKRVALSIFTVQGECADDEIVQANINGDYYKHWYITDFITEGWAEI